MRAPRFCVPGGASGQPIRGIKPQAKCFGRHSSALSVRCAGSYRRSAPAAVSAPKPLFLIREHHNPTPTPVFPSAEGHHRPVRPVFPRRRPAEEGLRPDLRGLPHVRLHHQDPPGACPSVWCQPHAGRDSPTTDSRSAPSRDTGGEPVLGAFRSRGLGRRVLIWAVWRNLT